MRLKQGEEVPKFFTKDIFGIEHSTEKYIYQKWMLSFFRYASCPACNLRIHKLGQVYDKLQEQGFLILAVFESPKESILDYVAKDELPFPIIPDPDRKLYQQFGVESSWLGYLKGIPTAMIGMLKGFLPAKMEGDLAMIPADFLIDEKGVIQTAYYGINIGDHLSIEQIWTFLNYK
ncbi:MAG: redoxin domain-containing protein [Candidatus Marinimicrobia bacterium]|jgi:peroxiredoxin|nr:redoxin domain-containing protein [Candidatus Neomarinimicrobiota bacterium]MBT3618243.1 redoxin domain-containing protein [Candidatus Neomarinimicrobiota bacterium]MBT4281642.1 redoxin domain-containing protein [Candidatus Neomarinimicrobiota bacterium]MBT4569216.1 redoxin domain-containing protein [Candidatus Neomarinimicrobiota bacterium]MBT5338857.1 redoxin domain-containing protein [Candidatus Neomarinimicrobiota bacterium]